MPIVTTEVKTKAGITVLRNQVSGGVSGEDAQALLDQLAVVNKRDGQSGHLLSIVAGGTQYSPESRRIFTGSMHEIMNLCAIVVTSTMVRAAINFMMRIRGRYDRIRFFSTEEEALAWLDEAR
jgi:hypothetical protein